MLLKIKREYYNENSLQQRQMQLKIAANSCHIGTKKFNCIYWESFDKEEKWSRTQYFENDYSWESTPFSRGWVIL